MKPLRVLLVAPSREVLGGQSVQAAGLVAAAARDTRVRYRWIPYDAPLPPWLRRIPVLRTLLSRIAFLWRVFWAQREADLLHVFCTANYSFLTTAQLALWAARRPVLLNCHDGRAEQTLARWPGARRFASRARLVAVPSGYLAEVLQPYGILAQVIPNAIDAESVPQRPVRLPRPVLLHNRGLEAHYNTACTVRAFARVQARYPDAALLVANDGPERHALEDQVREAGVRNVRFTGALPPGAARTLYAEADVYVTTPHVDNMPLSVLEAFAAGVPVVATRTGGIPFLIDHGRTGLLVTPDDDSAVAEAVFRLMEDRDLAADIAIRARAECERYSWPAVLNAWIAAYREITRPSPGTRA